MAIHGIEKHHEIKRVRILRDTRPLSEQIFEVMASLPAIAITYVCLVFLLAVFPAIFDVVLLFAAGYFFVPLNRKPDIPLRKRQTLQEIDDNDIHPGTKKARMARGVTFLGNRKSDNAEIWSAKDDDCTHYFIIGSTGAGKTEALLSIAFNSLVQGSGFTYCDGKGDIALHTKVFSMLRAMGREDDFLIINYMTGNADTTKKRSDKLSNTYNPFAVGNAESHIQLITSLMDASEGKGDMWKGRAISFLSSFAPALNELRDKGLLMLHIGSYREYMPFPRYFELMNNSNISPRSRDLMQAFLLDVPGYKRDKNDNQSATFLEQYGYQQMQFTRILSSLADTYGHIYFTPQGEVNLKDAVINRRVLLVMLPALEKSRPELGQLGKIVVTGMKGMMGSNLGSKVEGTKKEILDSRATNARTSYKAIFDELGYYLPEDAALMWAQARSLNFSLVAAGQDLQAFYRTSKEETLAIVSNSNIKMYGKLEDPTDTWDLLEKLAGEAYVSVVDGYNQDMNGVGGYRGSQDARIERVQRIELQDLREQIEGEVHILFKSAIIRARVFHADPKQVDNYRINHFVKVAPPDASELKAMKINTRDILESLEAYPFSKQRSADGFFVYAKSICESERYRDYLNCKLGVERGICLLLNFDETAAAVPPEPQSAAGSASGDSSSGSGSGGGYVLAPGEAAPPALASGPTGTALLAAGNVDATDAASLLAGPAASSPAAVAQDDVIYDAGKLEAITVFGGTPKQEPGQDILALVMAALPVIETAAETKIKLPAGADSSAEGGSLDEAGTEFKLNNIAKGLGASDAEAAEAAKAIIAVATGATEYPLPPKPEKDKADTMEDVMSDLESLINGSSNK